MFNSYKRDLKKVKTISTIKVFSVNGEKEITIFNKNMNIELYIEFSQISVVIEKNGKRKSYLDADIGFQEKERISFVLGSILSVHQKLEYLDAVLFDLLC